MLIRPLLLALIAACGVSNPDTDEQPIQPPDADKPAQDQHFCCKSVSTDKEVKVGHGEGCALAEKLHIGGCTTILYCPRGYTMDGGVVDCPL
ncbi:MAG TPA: hypothetical protein VK034_08655 [Enhygromyxa sp.]|nr:hypothetical protein [Enhygromyxa sp.]